MKKLITLLVLTTLFSHSVSAQDPKSREDAIRCATQLFEQGMRPSKMPRRAFILGGAAVGVLTGLGISVLNRKPKIYLVDGDQRLTIDPQTIRQNLVVGGWMATDRAKEPNDKRDLKRERFWSDTPNLAAAKTPDVHGVSSVHLNFLHLLSGYANAKFLNQPPAKATMLLTLASEASADPDSTANFVVALATMKLDPKYFKTMFGNHPKAEEAQKNFEMYLEAIAPQPKKTKAPSDDPTTQKLRDTIEKLELTAQQMEAILKLEGTDEEAFRLFLTAVCLEYGQLLMRANAPKELITFCEAVHEALLDPAQGKVTDAMAAYWNAWTVIALPELETLLAKAQENFQDVYLVHRGIDPEALKAMLKHKGFNVAN